MGTAYTPGLQVTRSTQVTKVRELPVAGRVLVDLGQHVEATTPVLAADLPGDLVIIRVADRMGFEPRNVIGGMRVQVGSSISRGDVICEVKSFFGLFTNTLLSTATGTVEFFTEANAHLGVRQPPEPLSVSAYIAGKVTQIEPTRSVTIECHGALIQGIFGLGGERLGTIRPVDVRSDRIVTAGDLRERVPELKDAILIGGAQFDREAIQFAVTAGAAAIVTGSIDAIALREFVGHELGVSITGDEAVPLTFIVTEGFGFLPISSSIVALSKKLAGKSASVNGATQVRAGAVRPEVVVPEQSSRSETVLAEETQQLIVGSSVRLIRVPYFGKFGKVIELPPEPQTLESGALVRVLHARLESGEEVVVPRANVELINAVI